MKIVPFTDNIWTAQRPLKMPGMNIGARMTIVRLASGDLWVHSPINPRGSDFYDQIDSLGKIKYIVAPNDFHNLFVKEFATHYSNAECYITSGIKQKIPDLKYSGVLCEMKSFPWQDEIETYRISGMPKFNEHEFYHRASRTLIVTDLIFNLGKPDGIIEKWVVKFFQCDRPNRPSRIFRMFMKDKKAFGKSVKPLLELQGLDKIIMSHGHPIKENGASYLDQAFSRYT